MRDVRWVSDDRLAVDGQEFRLELVERFESRSELFNMIKPAPLVQRYLSLLEDLRPERIIELGICKGGSTAFLALVTEPSMLSAVELDDRRLPALDKLVTERGLDDVVKLHYGVDQSDKSALRDLLAGDFAGESVDLVIDDASHRLGPTLQSFNVLFPALRAGGRYLVEDWSGLHHYDRVFTERVDSDPDLRAAITEKLNDAESTGAGEHQAETPLSAMLFLLVLVSAYAPDVVADLEIADGWCVVTRGVGDLGDDFDLESTVTTAARRMLPESADWTFDDESAD